MAAQGVRLRVVHGNSTEGAQGAAVSPHRIRIVDAGLDCIARQGTAKTTVDDVAHGAGVSRATVYRVFPGGKDELLAAVAETEMARLFSALGARMGAADDLSDVLVIGIVEAVTRITRHPALTYMVAHEPDVVLGHLAFGESNRLLGTAARFISPFLIRWMDPEEAARVAEWATRIVLSYCIAPSAEMDLTDAGRARHLIETFVLPGITALRAPDRSEPVDLSSFAGDRAEHTDRFHQSQYQQTHPTTTTTHSKGDVR
ncbi:MAG TPA: TetR/AcrR family transcriptional regulator [Acidimicrobiales bacterium]|nr:TetR/AcrR family transcriptional regulator [Acidimicrobiales bacterium]